MFEEMPESSFPDFLADFWGEQGWDTSVTANDDGTYLVAGDKDDGTRGLIGVRPDAETEVDASEVEDFAAFCEQKGVEMRVMATRGRFDTGAREAADSSDVHLLDPNELATSVRDEGVEYLVGEHGGGDGGGGLLDRLPTVPVSVPAGIPVVPILVAALVVVAAVFVGPTLLGSVPFVGDIGDSSGGGPSVTALSLSEANETVVDVKWDARTQAELGNYSAPPEQTFVVVQFEASARNNGTVALRPEHFALAVNDTFQSVQQFENTSRSFRSTQLPTPVSGNESARGVAVFLAPAEFDGATLVETYDGPGLRFERTRDLAFDVA